MKLATATATVAATSTATTTSSEVWYQKSINKAPAAKPTALTNFNGI